MKRKRKHAHKRACILLIAALILPSILLSLTFIPDIATAKSSTSLTSDTSTTTISTVSFSGMTWDVSGYANFANTAQQVWVDSNGYLHLEVSDVSGTWKNAEVVSQNACGYGIYTWVTPGVQPIDKNIVLGMFPYLQTANNSKEMDIEQAQWGDSAAPNFDFCVQPGNSNEEVFTVPYTTMDTTFSINWQPTYVQFSIIEGSTLIQSWTCDQARNASGVHAIMNLWQFSGSPSNGTPVGIVFKSFEFTPDGTAAPSPPPAKSSVPGAPTSLSVSQSSGTTTLNWIAPASNGGSAITEYNIYRGTSSGTETLLTSVSSTTLSYKDTTVVAGTTYYYTVAAVNSVGTSAMSSQVNVVVNTLHTGTPTHGHRR